MFLDYLNLAHHAAALNQCKFIDLILPHVKPNLNIEPDRFLAIAWDSGTGFEQTALSEHYPVLEDKELLNPNKGERVQFLESVTPQDVARLNKEVGEWVTLTELKNCKALKVLGLTAESSSNFSSCQEHSKVINMVREDHGSIAKALDYRSHSILTTHKLVEYELALIAKLK